MTSFRQLEQRHVNAEIALMEWNPMLDLIALATVNGEVILHRLSWQKVWSIASAGTKEKAVLVTALAWRPDGKILAYAYDNGKITLCDVENSEAVHLLDVHCVVTSLSWIQCYEKEDTEFRPFYTDRSSEFLQKHYAFNKAYGSSSKQSEEVADDFKKMKGQKDLNILAIGMEIGIVHLHSFGMFPSGFIDVNIQPDNPVHDKVISVTMSRDFRLLTVLLEGRDAENNYLYYFRSYSISLLYDYMEEIKIVSLKYGQISSLLTYLSSTIRAISEAWEDILLEVDTKLHNYAKQKEGLSEGSISDDFLELLMFGNPSDSLEKFLLHDLTESGLKKFGHSIELSYSNIQKLVLKRLQNVASSLFYHLNDFRGMAMWKERFGALGLEEAAINEAVLMVGSFLLKATEIQQVIDNSMKNFKAFFRWLYTVILRLSDEPIPMEISKLTQQDLHFVAEFLKENFTVDDEQKKTVKLERVAQYLKKEDLPYPANNGGNEWIRFVEEHPVLKDSGVVFPHFPEKSLITLYADLRKVIDTAVKGPWAVLKNTASLRSCYLTHSGGASHQSLPKVSHVCCPETGCMYTAVTDGTPPCSRFYLLRERSSDPAASLEAAAFTFNHPILDLKFYSQDTVTVLLQEDSESPVLMQLSVRLASEQLRVHQGQLGDLPLVDATPFVEKGHLKRLENVRAAQVAVSGSRKVVCVLFASRRQVRLFEMDVEDEEEEEETELEDSVMKDVSKEGAAFSDEEAEKIDQDESL